MLGLAPASILLCHTRYTKHLVVSGRQNKVRAKMSGMSDDMRYNIEFVKEIERHPCLYNLKHGEYNNKPSIDRAWQTVGEKFCGLNAAEIRLRWRSIRSSYSRSQRLKKDYYLSPHMDFLQPFTRTKNAEKKYNNSAKTNSDMDSDDESGSSDCSSQSAIETEPTKCEQDLDKDDEFSEYNGKIQVTTLPELKRGQSNRQIIIKTKGAQPKILLPNYESQSTKPSLSPHELYLKSLIPEVTSMDQRQYYNFRRGILKIIGKIKYSKEPPEYESQT